MIELMRENPVGTFIIILALIAVLSQLALAFINRNEPIMMGGSEDDCWDEEDDEH